MCVLCALWTAIWSSISQWWLRCCLPNHKVLLLQWHHANVVEKEMNKVIILPYTYIYVEDTLHKYSKWWDVRYVISRRRVMSALSSISHSHWPKRIVYWIPMPLSFALHDKLYLYETEPVETPMQSTTDSAPHAAHTSRKIIPYRIRHTI